jgi:tetratricopeptide (TPR) repeat protein
MTKVIQLPVTPPSKLGYKRANKRRCEGQLSLFTKGEPNIIQLPSRFSSFEEALYLDEQGNPHAQEGYLKAILEKDCLADSYCNLGILESKNGNTVRAFDCFTKCLKEDPRHLEAHYNLANLYFDVGNYNLAKLHYEIAAEIEPDFPNIYFNLGLVYALNEEYRDAVDALFKYKSLVPNEEGKKADNLLTSLRNSLANRNK